MYRTNVYGGILNWDFWVFYPTYNYLARPNDLGYPTTCVFPYFLLYIYKLGAWKCKNLRDLDKIQYGFSGSLITNPRSKLINSWSI